MTVTSRIRATDLSRTKRLDTDLQGDVTPEHTVGQATLWLRERMGIPAHDVPWNVFSRGVRLDAKTRLRDLPEADREWTLMPEVSAG